MHTCCAVLYLWCSSYFDFFFFQAEDGIRDHCVTGVQTCALPISSTGSDLAKIASASGIPRAHTVHTCEQFTVAFDEALRSHELSCIVAKVEAIGPKGYVTELSLLENRFQFAQHIAKLKKAR